MAATWVSENVQSNTTAASDKTLTFAATAFTAGDVVTIDVIQNNDTLGFPTANTPTGGTGVTWTLIKTQQGTTSQFTQTSAWWAVIPSDQTATFAQTTLRSPANALSTRGVMRRWQGVNTTTPIRQVVGYGNNTSDPLITNTNLQLTQMKAGDAACASGGDWSAQTTITTQFDSGLSRTESINVNEAGQMHFISYYQSSTLAADDADVRAEMDASAATGNWSAIMYALAAASTAEVGYDVSRFLPRGMIAPTGFLRDTYSYIETPPVVTTSAQPWAQILITPEPVVVPLLAQVLPGLDPRVVETVPVPQLLRLLNIAQPLTAATIVGGWDPSVAETVRISLLVQALNVVQSPTVGVVVGGWDPTALRTVVLSPVVRADAPRITPYPNQVFVALQVGNAPPVTGVFYIGLIQANALVAPLQQAAVAVGEHPPLVSTVPVVPYTRGVPWAVPGASSLILPGLHPNLVETVPVIPLTYGLARSIAMQQLTLRTGITIGIPPPIFGLIPTVYGTAVVVRRSDGVVLLGLQAGNAPPLDPYLLENFTTIFSTNDTVLTLSDSGLVVVTYIDPTTLTVFDQTAEYDHVDDQGGTRD